jgi:hypothetical protein
MTEREQIEAGHRLGGITVQVRPAEKNKHEPVCGCGWHGKITGSKTNAHSQIEDHYANTGHPLLDAN